MTPHSQDNHACESTSLVVGAGNDDDGSKPQSRRRSQRSPGTASTSVPPFSLQRSLQLLAMAAVLVIVGLGAGLLLANRNVTETDDDIQHQEQQQQQQHEPHNAAFVGSSKYTTVQYFGFQIYTGGAPAFLDQQEMDDDHGNNNNNTNTNITTRRVPNPECHGLHSYGEAVLEVDPVLMCYLGHADPMVDAEHRLRVMRRAVERAYQQQQDDPSVLKIFVAPEFFFRGLSSSGSYEFTSLDQVYGGDDCDHPICSILKGLEDIVQDERFQDWFFLFGTVIASQTNATEQDYNHLFYNVAPIYKGFDPKSVKNGAVPRGKRFLLPKRYVSDSDFLNEPFATRKYTDGNWERGGWEELLDAENQPNTTDNPFYKPRKRYDDHLFDNWKNSLKHDAGYTQIEYDWLVIDGIVMTLEVCFDHYKKTALNTYLGDIVKGGTTRIPSSSDNRGLEYVPIPSTMAQIGLVSSAGMTINADSMALTQHGVLFLQDGMSNASSKQYIDYDLWNSCDQGIQFDGGTEAVSRRAIVSNTDVNFLYQVHDPVRKVPVYDDEESYEKDLRKTFSTAVYDPHLIVYDSIPIPPVQLH